MRIACLLGPDFEDAEFRIPYDQFRAHGHGVTIVGTECGLTLHGERRKEKIVAEVGIGDVRAEEFDAVFIPGGYSPDRLRTDERVVKFVQQFAGFPIFSIGHGAQLLLTANMVAGKVMTAWKSIQSDLDKVGAYVLDRRVVVDGNLVTSRKPADLEVFVASSLSVLDKHSLGLEDTLTEFSFVEPVAQSYAMLDNKMAS
jgi:protease I